MQITHTHIQTTARGTRVTSTCNYFLRERRLGQLPIKSLEEEMALAAGLAVKQQNRCPSLILKYDSTQQVGLLLTRQEEY